MEAFLSARFKVTPWIRRLATRLVAIVPALVTILVYGDSGLTNLLIYSQVILSFQLPFAVWPLLYFTFNESLMSVEFVGPSQEELNDPNGALESSGSIVERVYTNNGS